MTEFCLQELPVFGAILISFLFEPSILTIFFFDDMRIVALPAYQLQTLEKESEVFKD